VDPSLRILDACRNRSGEALRTLEDLARFALNDGELSAGLKDLRHRLAAAFAILPSGSLAANRDVAGDVGRAIEGRDEYRREGLPGVAAAAGHRLAEALRSMEEVAKTVESRGELARALERLRYASYPLAAAIEARVPGPRREQWTVCVLLTRSLCRRPWDDVLAAAIDGGADAIQVREKDLDGGELVELVGKAIERARPAGVRVIVNDRVDVALAAGADGVHVGQSDLAPAAVRSIAGRRLAIGVSTHDDGEARRAAAEAADYCGVGAMFASRLKPGLGPSGPGYLARFLAAHPGVPHLAIGGIDPANVGTLADLGCRGVAVSGCVCGAERPDETVRTLRTALGSPVRKGLAVASA
jgi:thiamine-phosphate pyrophosphorylase